MPVLFETKPIPVPDRREALMHALREASGAAKVVLGEEPVHARLEYWSFGPLTMFRAEATGLSLIRTAKSARSDSAQFVAVAVHEGGQAVHRADAVTRVVRPGDLLMVDVTRPFDFTWQGYGASRTLQVPLDQLGLPADVVRRAGLRLSRSPLYRLVSRHIQEMSRDADRLSATNAAGALGCATIDLVRALILSAAEEPPGPREVSAQTLVAQARAYVRGHLGDPALSPDSIAAALAVSPRQLYRSCAAAELRLSQWIITTRLERAKAELTDPRARRQSIAAIARHWGFKDPTHFTRRFRAAYGILPSEWRKDS